MAKRIINEGITVVRDGKRVRPEIGKAFDLTAEEIAQLEKIRPKAIAKLDKVEDDPRSTDTDTDDDGAADDAAAAAAAAKPAAKTGAKSAGKGKAKADADEEL